MPIEAVVFDYGGVLSVSPFGQMAGFEQLMGLAPGTLSDLLGYGLDVPEPAPGEPYTNKWHLLETGEIELGEWADWVTARAAAHFGREVDVWASMRGAFGSMSIYWPMVHEIRRLRGEGYRLAVCTNNIAAYRDAWRDQVPVELFDVVVDSSEVGVRKPDPAIYRLTCERLGVGPASTAFLDDHPANVAGAEALGIRSVLVGDDVLAAIDALRSLLAEP